MLVDLGLWLNCPAFLDQSASPMPVRAVNRPAIVSMLFPEARSKPPVPDDGRTTTTTGVAVAWIAATCSTGVAVGGTGVLVGGGGGSNGSSFSNVHVTLSANATVIVTSSSFTSVFQSPLPLQLMSSRNQSEGTFSATV